MVKYFGDSQ